MRANLNKENLITVDVKNATVEITSGSMTFYATDENTCNIFCKLTTPDTDSNLIDLAIMDHVAIDNAEDFAITMRMIDPNGDPLELEFTLLDSEKAIFYVDLADEYMYYAGTYKCELFVDCIAKEKRERITTSPFSYEVKKSIWSELDNNLNGDPAQSVIDTLATMVYVDDSIAAIPETDLLIDFAPISYVDDSIRQYDNKITKQDFASREYVNNVFNNIKYEIDIAGYTTESYVDNEIGKLNTGINSLLINNYAPISYVDNAINELKGSGDDSFATKLYVNQEVAELRTDIANNYINKTDYAADKENIYNTLSAYNYGDTIDDINQRINLIVSKYAPISYVDQKISEAQLSSGDIDLSNYVTKDNLSSSLSRYATYDYVHSYFNTSIDNRLEYYATKEYVGDEIRKLSNSMLNYSDIEFYMEDYLWTNEYTTKDYVNEAIANAQISGGEGGDIDLSDYATKEYVDGIMPVIDKGDATGEITYDDFPDGQMPYKLNGTVYFTVDDKERQMVFRNEIAYVDKRKVGPINLLRIWRTRIVNDATDGPDYLNINNGKTTSYHFFATQSYVDNAIADKADKSYVEASINSALGDIESLLEEI